MTPTMPLRGQRERQVVDEEAVAERLGEVVGLHDDAAQSRARRDLDLLHVELAGLLGLGRHLLVAVKAGPALGLTSLGVGPHPGELVLEAPLELGVLLALDLEAGGLGLQVGGVVALVGVALAAVDLEDPLGDVVEEVPIVGDGHNGAGVLLEVLLEPLDALGIEVVRGLVEQEEIGLLQKQLAQGHAALLTTGEHGDVGVAGRASQGVHGLVELGIEVPRVAVVDVLLQLAHLGEQRVVVGVRLSELGRDLVEAVDHGLGLGHAVLDVLEHRLGLVEHRLLHEDPDGVALHQLGLAVGQLVDAGHDLDQAGLSGAVGADDTDLGPWQERQRDVVEDDLVAVRLAGLAKGVDELSHGHGA